MIIKSLSFEDLDGKKVTETHCFHLSKAELAELSLSYEGGFDTYLKTIVETNDRRKIMDAFKNIIQMTYGRREGSRFVKDKDEAKAFMQSEAFGALFLELLSSPNAAAEFVRGVVPGDLANLSNQANQMLADGTVKAVLGPQAEVALQQAFNQGQQRTVDVVEAEKPQEMQGLTPSVAIVDEWTQTEVNNAVTFEKALKDIAADAQAEPTKTPVKSVFEYTQQELFDMEKAEFAEVLKQVNPRQMPRALLVIAAQRLVAGK